VEKKPPEEPETGSEERPTPHAYAKTSVIFQRLRERHKTSSIKHEENGSSGIKEGPTGKKERQKRWLRVYSATGQKPTAHRAVGINPSTFYDWVRDDEDFKARLFEADENVTDILEATAMRRAQAGSDFMLTVLLNANRPQKYRPTRDGISGNADPEAVAAAMMKHKALLDDSFGRPPSEKSDALNEPKSG